MKLLPVLPFLLIASLVGCTQLNDEDRMQLLEARAQAKAAKNQAEQADYEARLAHEDAEAAAERADRIFRQSQGK